MWKIWRNNCVKKSWIWLKFECFLEKKFPPYAKRGSRKNWRYLFRCKISDFCVLIFILNLFIDLKAFNILFVYILSRSVRDFFINMILDIEKTSSFFCKHSFFVANYQKKWDYESLIIESINLKKFASPYLGPKSKQLIN